MKIKSIQKLINNFTYNDFKDNRLRFSELQSLSNLMGRISASMVEVSTNIGKDAKPATSKDNNLYSPQ